MATITDRLPKTNKFYFNPVYGKQTQIDEKRFVEDYLAHPKETLDKYGIPYTLNKMVFTFLFKYGYWYLGLRNIRTSYESETMFLSDWVFETAKEKAVECGMSQKEVDKEFGVYRCDMTNAVNCCYGYEGVQGRLYNNILQLIRHQCVNWYEFNRAMKPFEIGTVYLYKDEVETILSVFDELLEIIIALHMIMRAKHFQAHKLSFDNVEMEIDKRKGVESLKVNESKYWYTPCIRDSSNLTVAEGDKKITHSRYFKHEIGVNYAIIPTYKNVYNRLVETGLFATSEDFNGGLRNMKAISKVTRKTRAYRIASARLYGSVLSCNCYRPTFLTLEKDEEPVITITYEDYENGYVFKFLEYLCSIHHKSVKPYTRCKIVDCKGCGKRFGVLYDGRSKGKTPTTCAACGSGKGRVARYRRKL